MGEENFQDIEFPDALGFNQGQHHLGDDYYEKTISDPDNIGYVYRNHLQIGEVLSDGYGSVLDQLEAQEHEESLNNRPN